MLRIRFRRKVINKLEAANDGILINDKLWIGGYRIQAIPIYDDDKKLNAYLNYRSFQNLVNALNRMGIPFQMTYYSLNGRTILTVLTIGRELDEMRRNLFIVENTFKAIYPNYQLHPLTGSELRKLYLWGKVGSQNPNPHFFIIEDNYSQGIKPRSIFKLPVLSEATEGDIILGRVIDTNEIYRVRLGMLSRHLTCIGTTGTGKTTTIATILNQLPPQIKYMVIDIHNEYDKLLNNYERVLRIGRDQVSLNPLKIWSDIDEEEHISMISDIFSEVYGFTHPQAYYFKMVLESTFSGYRLTGEPEPNLPALVKILEEYPIKSYSENETKMALLRRLKQLVEGQASRIFSNEDTFNPRDLMNKNVIIQVGDIREVLIRKIFIYIILKTIYDHQLIKGKKNFNHVTVIEEAKYILPPRRDYDPPNIGEKLVNELRKFGESVFIVSQFPSQLTKDIIKNSGFLIIHRLSGYEDIRVISNIISLTHDQIEYMKQLDIGEAIIRDTVNPLPFPIKVKPIIKAS